MKAIERLIVLDGNAPWVRSLFLAMPNEIEVRVLHIGQPQVFRKLSGRSWWIARNWQICGPNASERWIIIPGWNKSPGISTWLTRRAVDAANDERKSTAIVFALPQHAGVAEATTLRPRIYYAHDPFEFYGWNPEATRALETRMLNATEATFAISRLLRDDLKARTDHPVFYSPNAVSPAFIASMQLTGTDVPADLAGIVRPIVGCTGQINETYDWPMLAELVTRMADVSFVFIGPIVAPSDEVSKQIDGVLKGRANVHWLDRKPHEVLPKYLQAFDVCLNPLAPGPHADRRSPLRLYDYLATGKPVVSTAIEEASSHENQVWIGKNAEEIEAVIRSALSGERKVDAEKRREYLQRNTWPARATEMLRMIEKIDAPGGRSVKVAAYVHLLRTLNPTTGVGKHIVNMTRGLSVKSDVDLTVLAARAELDANKQIREISRLHGMAVKSFPLPVRIMEQIWRRMNFPAADLWVPDSNWIYSPAEAYLPPGRAKLAVTIHDVAAFEPDLPWSQTAKHRQFRKSFDLIFRRLKQNAEVFLTVSEFSRQRLAELLSISLSRIAVVGNGVEEEYFQVPAPDEVWQINQPDPYILVVGGVNERKGGEHLIALAQLLQDRKSPLRMHVAGLHETPLLERALKLSNVTNLGFITDEQLLRATRGAAMSMLLSRYEGFGIPALEAMAAGVPAIVSPHSALPEIVGDAGIIVQPEDSAGIADACHRLVEDIPYRESVIARGRINALRYRWSDCVDRLHRVLIERS